MAAYDLIKLPRLIGVSGLTDPTALVRCHTPNHQSFLTAMCGISSRRIFSSLLGGEAEITSFPLTEMQDIPAQGSVIIWFLR
jgi:hypothetical protein